MGSAPCCWCSPCATGSCPFCTRSSRSPTCGSRSSPLFCSRESANLYKLLGIAVVVVGVAVLGRGAQAVKTPISSMLLVFVASFIGSFGAVFLKAGAGRLHRQMERLSSSTGALPWGWRSICSPRSSSCWEFAEGELTILYPMVSLGYVWTLLWSRIFFGERLTRNKVVGIGMVLAGDCPAQPRQQVAAGAHAAYFPRAWTPADGPWPAAPAAGPVLRNGAAGFLGPAVHPRHNQTLFEFLEFWSSGRSPQIGDLLIGDFQGGGQILLE